MSSTVSLLNRIFTSAALLGIIAFSPATAQDNDVKFTSSDKKNGAGFCVG